MPRDKAGNQLTWSEFFKRWGEGIQGITALQQTKTQIIGQWLILAGIVWGLVVIFILEMWWLFAILVGSFIVSAIGILGSYQKYWALKRVDDAINDNLHGELKFETEVLNE